MGGVEPPSGKTRYITDVIARNRISLTQALLVNNQTILG